MEGEVPSHEEIYKEFSQRKVIIARTHQNIEQESIKIKGGCDWQNPKIEISGFPCFFQIHEPIKKLEIYQPTVERNTELFFTCDCSPEQILNHIVQRLLKEG